MGCELEIKCPHIRGSLYTKPIKSSLNAAPKTHPVYISLSLCSPNPLDGLGNTNVVGLKLVEAVGDEKSESSQNPGQKCTHTGNAPGREVVNDASIEANVGVNDEQTAENRVGNGIQRASSEGSDAERDESSRDESLKSPVIAAVGGRWLWHRGGVVGRTLDLLGQRREDGAAGSGVEGPQRRQSTANKRTLDWPLDERLGCSESGGSDRGLGGDDALGGEGDAGPQGRPQDGRHCASLVGWT